MAGLRRGRRGTFKSGSVASVGFLDVNFGVLGIFVVIFALRILLLQSQSADRYDFLVIITNGTAEKSGLASVYMDDDLQVIEGVFGDEIYKPENAFGTAIRAYFLERAAKLQMPLRVGFILLPEGFDAMKAINASLGGDAVARGETFLPLEFQIIPATTQELAAEIVTEWANQQ
jgi:hypothetical protein